MAKIIYETHVNGHWKELFKSKNKLLGGHNLDKDEELCATINSVATEQVYDKETNGQKELVVLTFQGGIPPMALNVTNADTISLMYGHRYQEWKDKKVLIHAITAKFFGKMQDALRIRAKVPRGNDFGEYEQKLNSC